MCVRGGGGEGEGGGADRVWWGYVVERLELWTPLGSLQLFSCYKL